MRFFIFIFVFLTLYGGLNFYAFVKIRKAFVLSRGAGLFLICFMLFMVFCPIIVRVVEKLGMESLSRLLAYAGYVWMGGLFLFVCCSFIIDLYRFLLLTGTYFFNTDFAKWTLSPRSAFLVALTVSVLVTAYGYFEALNIKTERITIKTSKIPKELGRFRIVQISDVHLGLIVGEGRLERILKEVRSENPDILVATGDLLDGQVDNISKMADKFRLIKPPYGKFAVTGNHEFYAGLKKSLSFMKEAGFIILRGATHDIRGVVLVAGVDDEAGKRFGLSEEMDEVELLSNLSKDRFVLLLKHRPLFDQGSEGLFDLQLSGHTHGGQIFPFSLIIKMLYPIHAGLLALNKDTFLYASRGAGTWGPPIRFLAPPEVTVIDLVHGKDENPQARRTRDY